MSKPLSITVHPSPVKNEFLTVSDAMKQVLDLIEVMDKIETADGGEKTLVWRLVKAHTNSPPFTIVAEAFPVHPTISVVIEAARVANLFVEGIDDLLVGRAPDWVDQEIGKPLRRAFERNTNGISRTVIDYGDSVQIDISPKDARAGLATLERIVVEEDAKKADWSRTEYGSFEGEVAGIIRWNNRPALIVVERLSGEKCTCVLDDELADEIGPAHSWLEAWEGRRLLITGSLHFDANNILKRADVRELRQLAYTDVSVKSLRGIDLLQGLTVRDHLKRLRGDNNG